MAQRSGAAQAWNTAGRLAFAFEHPHGGTHPDRQRGEHHQAADGYDRYFRRRSDGTWIGTRGHRRLSEIPGVNPDDYDEAKIKLSCREGRARPRYSQGLPDGKIQTASQQAALRIFEVHADLRAALGEQVRRRVESGRYGDMRGPMSRDVELQCRCGKVHGWLRDAAPDTVNRVVCYCDDCQAFLHHLGRAELLDEHGGSDIVQVAPSTLSFDRGLELVTAVRLTPQGLYRWYASCCKTPLGNTVSARLPFVGIVTELFQQAPNARPCDEVFGAPVGGILGKFAIGTPPPGSVKPNVRLIARAIRMVLGWKLRGKTWPHPFFDRASGHPKYPVTVLSTAERDALRPLCGPRPARA